ncbi:515_t:CDS:2, partial [Dentiscutata erythropus]
DFYKTRNILNPQIFEDQFKSLQECYPKAAPYLNRALYTDRQSWARAYTFCHFTASTQVTSRVESINSHIKSIIRHSTTLYDLFNSLDSLIASQDYYYDFISWKSSNPNIKLSNVCDTMYPNVNAILKSFIAPNLIEKIRYEINHSLFYHPTRINTESLHSCQIQDNDDNEAFIDNAFDYLLAHSLALFKQVEDKVVEAFFFGNSVSLAVKFSINFVAKCWLLEKYQDEKDLGIQPLVNLSTVFLSELSKDDPNVLKFLKTYILQNYHSLVENTTNTSASGHKTSILKEHPKPNVIVDKAQISNSIKKVRRGRPPKTAHYQSAMENQSLKAQEKQSKPVCGPGTNTEKKNESEWVGSSSSESDVEMDTDE